MNDTVQRLSGEIIGRSLTKEDIQKAFENICKSAQDLSNEELRTSFEANLLSFANLLSYDKALDLFQSEKESFSWDIIEWLEEIMIQSLKH